MSTWRSLLDRAAFTKAGAAAIAAESPAFASTSAFPAERPRGKRVSYKGGKASAGVERERSPADASAPLAGPTAVLSSLLVSALPLLSRLLHELGESVSAPFFEALVFLETGLTSASSGVDWLRGVEPRSVRASVTLPLALPGRFLSGL